MAGRDKRPGVAVFEHIESEVDGAVETTVIHKAEMDTEEEELGACTTNRLFDQDISSQASNTARSNPGNACSHGYLE